ncbi:hypothetical protein [Pseudomonas viridiflava]|uniref:hypothetical protein n=1 Tax=Pseudomonas viridiflava TaxID=33069 RepID=UPI000F02F194|nr:hypothetical protein [Pseudomonas viridiflava]
MGLDISVFLKLAEAPEAARDSDGNLADYETHREFYDNPDFPGRIEGLKPEMVYRIGEHGDGLCAGSYGGYNRWRNELAQMAGYPLTEYDTHYGKKAEGYDAGAWAAGSGPFFEQIQFSDCEGTIGPVVSAKLAKDYEEFAERAESVGGRFWEKYQEWRAAFDAAADGGAVVFH